MSLVTALRKQLQTKPWPPTHMMLSDAHALTPARAEVTRSEPSLPCRAKKVWRYERHGSGQLHPRLLNINSLGKCYLPCLNVNYHHDYYHVSPSNQIAWLKTSRLMITFALWWCRSVLAWPQLLTPPPRLLSSHSAVRHADSPHGRTWHWPSPRPRTIINAIVSQSTVRYLILSHSGKKKGGGRKIPSYVC